MKKTLNDVMQLLSRRDLDTLHSIYQFRCLNENQIYQLHFQQVIAFDESMSKEHANTRIQEMLELGVIKDVEYNSEERVYFMTPLGIEAIVRFFEIPENFYDAQKKAVKRGYYRASELELYPKNINHQVYLNQFVVDFTSMKIDSAWKYYDEKYVSQYNSIRPDGMLSVYDTDFFLEMDMGTESRKQLCEKWEHYRNFLISREYAYREKRIVVLFIVEGNNDMTKERIDLVKYTIYERLLDVLHGSEFEIYVGTSNELLSLLKHRLIPASKEGVDPYNDRIKKALEEKHGFIVSDGDKIKDVFDGTQFTYFIRRISENYKTLHEEGRVQEYLVDDYFFDPPTVIAKVAYMEKNNTLFKHRFKRDISYVIIGKTEEQLYRDLKMVDLLGLKNIFFSTYHRLRDKPFHEAVFQFDLFGDYHHFTNNGLAVRVFEGSLETIHLNT
jgi:hypothetical protein